MSVRGSFEYWLAGGDCWRPLGDEDGGDFQVLVAEEGLVINITAPSPQGGRAVGQLFREWDGFAKTPRPFHVRVAANGQARTARVVLVRWRSEREGAEHHTAFQATLAVMEWGHDPRHSSGSPVSH